MKKRGSHRASKIFSSKQSAVQWAQEVSKGHATELYIHDKDGRIVNRLSYSRDPFPVKEWQAIGSMDVEANGGLSSNIFINCPFDEDYEPLKKALLYVVVALGLNPRIATERADAGEQRLSKICELIGESIYSIHDLSRIKAKRPGDFSRMNMPFELGVDYGSRRFAPGTYGEKQFLILETKRFDYMKALSDLNGVDVEAHSNDPRILIRKVRNWLVTSTGDTKLAAPSALWYDYADFNADLYDKLKNLGFSDDDIGELPVVEYLDYARRWLAARSA